MLDSTHVKARMAELLEVPCAQVQDEVQLTDVVLDSFALVELVIGLEHEFDVDLVHEDLVSVRTVGDLVQRFQERSRS